MPTRSALQLLLALLLVLQASSVRAADIPLFTYHTHPPFITGDGTGLSYDLAHYLTARAEGRFTFTVKPMSRPRVDKMLAEQRPGIIPWVNPAWFKDPEEKKYHWTRAHIMVDSNAVVSHSERSLVYRGPQSLGGLVLGGVRGHVYAEVDDAIASTGDIKRVDAENHVDNFRKLARQRVDVTICPKSGADYLIKQEGLEKTLYISPQPHSTYVRKLLVTGEVPGLSAFIEEVAAMMATDPEWQQLATSYQ